MNEADFNYTQIYWRVIVAALGALSYGYTLGMFSPNQDYLKNFVYPDVSKGIIYFTVAVHPIGAIIGSGIAGPLAIKYGRRMALMIIDIIMIIGSIISILPHISLLMIGRFIVGFVTGINSALVPLYIGEVVPKQIKGKFGSFNSLGISSGMMISYIFGLGSPLQPEDDSSHWWRVMFIMPGVIELIRLILLAVVFTEDTPVYSILTNRTQEAEMALRKIYKTPEKALSALNHALEDYRKNQKKARISFKDLFTPAYRKALFLGCFLAFMFQLNGNNYIVFYSNSIFKDGIDDPSSKTPKYFSIYLGAAMTVAAIVAASLIHKFGRKTIMVFGEILIGLSYLAFILVKAISDDSPTLKYFIILAGAAFFLTTGGVRWVYFADILPALGLSTVMIINWLGTFLVAQVSPLLSDEFGPITVFSIFAIVCFFMAFFIKVFIKETKGLDHFEMQRIYSRVSSEKKVNEMVHIPNTENTLPENNQA